MRTSQQVGQRTAGSAGSLVDIKDLCLCHFVESFEHRQLLDGLIKIDARSLPRAFPLVPCRARQECGPRPIVRRQCRLALCAVFRCASSTHKQSNRAANAINSKPDACVAHQVPGNVTGWPTAGRIKNGSGIRMGKDAKDHTQTGQQHHRQHRWARRLWRSFVLRTCGDGLHRKTACSTLTNRASVSAEPNIAAASQTIQSKLSAVSARFNHGLVDHPFGGKSVQGRNPGNRQARPPSMSRR